MTRLAVLVAFAFLAVATSAQARTAPCVPGESAGPRCHWWDAKVTAIDDGDTLLADVDGDGTHRSYVTRLDAVQAFELTKHNLKHPSRRRGFCNAIPATNRLTQLVRRSHYRIRLSAQNPASRSDVRLERSVAVEVHGTWRDAGEMLIREGHAIWLPIGDEDAWNARYLKAEQEAMQAGRFIWDPELCGAGPEQGAKLQVWPMWNPIGYDPSNLAGEYSVVRNVGPAPVSLGGWWLRSSTTRSFTFPADTSLAPGDSVTVHTGPSSGFSFGFNHPMFENPGDSHHLGDGLYLFDPDGDVRAALSYPCMVACTDKLQGAVTLSVHERDPESFTVRNVSTAPADLYGYAIALPGSLFAFEPGTVLPPGGTLRVTPSDFGVHQYILPDRGGSARLATFGDVTVACDAWGSGRC